MAVVWGLCRHWKVYRYCTIEDQVMVHLYFLHDHGFPPDCVLHPGFLDEYETLHPFFSPQSILVSIVPAVQGLVTVNSAVFRCPSVRLSIPFAGYTAYLQSSSEDRIRVSIPSLFVLPNHLYFGASYRLWPGGNQVYNSS